MSWTAEVLGCSCPLASGERFWYRDPQPWGGLPFSAERRPGFLQRGSRPFPLVPAARLGMMDLLERGVKCLEKAALGQFEVTTRELDSPVKRQVGTLSARPGDGAVRPAKQTRAAPAVVRVVWSYRACRLVAGAVR